VTAAQAPRRAGLFRRFGSALYDLLLVAALLLVATFPFLGLLGDSTHGWRRHVLQLYVVAVAGAYFVGFWTHGGQTLAMKTWHIRVVRFDGLPLTRGRAVHRYLLAILSLLAVGLGFLWALVDRDRQFLHDRLAGTAIVDATLPTAAPPA
jgi:uncharacterized RDD family membrane protein YckC